MNNNELLELKATKWYDKKKRITPKGIILIIATVLNIAYMIFINFAYFQIPVPDKVYLKDITVQASISEIYLFTDYLFRDIALILSLINLLIFIIYLVLRFLEKKHEVYSLYEILNIITQKLYEKNIVFTIEKYKKHIYLWLDREKNFGCIIGNVVIDVLHDNERWIFMLDEGKDIDLISINDAFEQLYNLKYKAIDKGYNY